MRAVAFDLGGVLVESTSRDPVKDPVPGVPPEYLLGATKPESIAVLADLRQQGMPVYLLTNWSVEKFAAGRRRYDFLELFDERIIVGDEVGLRKPDTRLFRHLLDVTGSTPEELVMVDDREEHLVGARRLGIGAILFSDATTLRAELIRRGYLSASKPRLYQLVARWASLSQRLAGSSRS